MSYKPVVFNENALRNLVKEVSKSEFENSFKKFREELDKLWNFLNKLREDILVIQSEIEIIEKSK